MADKHERDTKSTTDEVGVNVILGPYRGKTLKMPQDKAQQAVADGWALEAGKEYDPAAEALQPDKLAETMEKAEIAAAEMRGENVPVAPGGEKRDQTAKPARAGYETRDQHRDPRRE